VNYSAIYDRLVERARTRPEPPVVERHHVIPKCMGGSDGLDNIALLTPREHLFAHKLLVRMHPDVSGLWLALVLMGRLVNYKSKIFESERIKARQIRKQFRYSKKSKQKMSESAKKRGRNGKDTEFKPGLVPWNKGLSPEKSHRFGKKHSAETRKKMIETQRKLRDIQSERMKLWWAERKRTQVTNQERANP